jgi:hypothetical protein
MNKTTLYVNPENKGDFEKVCTTQRMEFKLIISTDRNLVYEVTFTMIQDLFYLGIHYGLGTIQRKQNEAHTH